MTEQTNAARLRELNETIRYTMWSVYRATSPLPSLREIVVDEVESLFSELAGKGATDPWLMGGALVLLGCCYCATAAALHAAELSTRRLEDWERAAADLRALERLDERHRDEWRAEQLRDEQRVLDEISTRKRT